MTIWEAPITTTYGAVKGYPLNPIPDKPGYGFHNGIDYGAPIGTDVTVNGVVIGKSGNTGASTGPHCHVGHWNGGTVLDPGVQGGKVVSGAVVSQVSEDATNGKFIRVQDADGTNWVYLHLSEQLVTVGQKLEQGDEMQISEANLYSLIRGMLGREPTSDEMKTQAYYEDANLAIGTFWNNGGKQRYENPPTGKFKPYDGKPLFTEE